MVFINKNAIKLIKHKTIICMPAGYYVMEHINNISFIGTNGDVLLKYGEKKGIVYYFMQGVALCGKTANGALYYFYDLIVTPNTFFQNLCYLTASNMCSAYMSMVLQPLIQISG